MNKIQDKNKYLSLLKKAFPKKLSEDVETAFNALELTDMFISSSDKQYEVTTLMHDETTEQVVNDEVLIIPYRVYFNDSLSEAEREKLTLTQRKILNCILSRSANGYVRERSLKRMENKYEYWMMPYIMLLLSDYVVEILIELQSQFSSMTLELYSKYINENPSSWEKTKDRIISYWAQHYRNDYPRWKEYVGFEIMKTIEKSARKNISLRKTKSTSNMEKLEFKQYDHVKITKISKDMSEFDDKRMDTPEVGDEATIVEIYENNGNIGFELEDFWDEWLYTFDSEEIEFTLLGRQLQIEGELKEFVKLLVSTFVGVDPNLDKQLQTFPVSSIKYTVVGMYVYFHFDPKVKKALRETSINKVLLDGTITKEGEVIGEYILFLKDGFIDYIEIYTFTGVFEYSDIELKKLELTSKSTK